MQREMLGELELLMLEKERTLNAIGEITMLRTQVARFNEFPLVSCQTFWGGIHTWSLTEEQWLSKS